MAHRILDSRSFVFLAALLAMSAAPLVAQGGRDLLVQPVAEPPVRVGAVRPGLIERPADVPVSVRARDVRSARPNAVRIPQPATELYQHDDDDLEAALYLVDDTTEEPLFEFELAQSFRLPRAGTVEYAVVCMGRGVDDTSADVDFSLNFYSGDRVGAGHAAGGIQRPNPDLPEPDRYACFELAGDLVGLELDSGRRLGRRLVAARRRRRRTRSS